MKKKLINSNQNHYSDKKQLLTDPVKYFIARQPDNTGTIKAITLLHQQRISLQQQQKKLQIQTGVLSRQIGDVKRNGQNTAPLLFRMKNLSAEKKFLAHQIKQLNQSILGDFFSPDADNTINPETGDTGSARRYYPTTNINIDEITISMLDTTADNDIMQNQAWNDYVTANSAACIHHRIEWRNIHRQSYAHNSLYFYARNKQHAIVGILPLIQLKSRLFGNQLVSMPFFQRGGAVADNPQIEQKLIQVAARYAQKLHVDHIELRDDISHENYSKPLPVQTHKVNMILSLPDTKQALWETFSAKLRSQIRRAQRETTQVLIGRKELLDEFYRVYSHNMRDLGSPVQGKPFIANILSTFPENSWLVIIRYQQRPVAAAFLLGSGDTLEIPLASTLRSVNPLSINMLLYREVLNFAISKKFKQFDFGRSSKNGGTYRFKQQWGAQPKQLYWHYYLGKSNKPPSLNTANPKYALLINIWKHLPLTLSNWLGPIIVKNIP